MIESVRGTIVGGQYLVGKLYLNGKLSIDRSFIGDTDAEVKAAAEKYLSDLKSSIGPEYERLYPNGLELRIYV